MTRRKASQRASNRGSGQTPRRRAATPSDPVSAPLSRVPRGAPRKGDTWRTEGTSIVPGRLLVYDGAHWRVAEEGSKHE